VLLGIKPTLVAHVHATFVPEPLRVVYFGYFFLVGTWLGRYRSQLGRLIPCSNYYLVLLIPVSLALQQLMRGQPAGGGGNGHPMLVAVSCALLAWLSIFGYLGLFLRFCQQRRAGLRYLADASYWIYLSHLPVVMLAQVALARVPGWPVAKFLAVTGIALLLGVASYQWLVRPTFIGAILGEPRRKRSTAAGFLQGHQPVVLPVSIVHRSAPIQVLID
jgi:peptidoglycan/LPS O-acetylase OafA/YrhL